MKSAATAVIFALCLSPTGAAPLGPVASIRGGAHDCPHCQLAGADLTNQCVKGGNLTGADFDNARLVLACMSKADFTGASFRDADLTGANLADSRLDDADLSGANLTIASLKGTNLSRARGLTQAQLDGACGNAETRVPAGLIVRRCE